MFLQILFKKLGLKQNKYVMALIYGLIYSIITFFLFLFSTFFITKFNLFRYFTVSLIIGLFMFGIYLFKWELFDFKKA